MQPGNIWALSKLWVHFSAQLSTGKCAVTGVQAWTELQDLTCGMPELHAHVSNAG